MSAETNDWKLGLFVCLVLAAAGGVVVLLGAAKLDETRIEWVSYFDESVEGLDVGSPVKFRGAPLGRVTEIGIAPDQRRVAVGFAISVRRLKQLGFDPGEHAVLPATMGMGRIPGDRAHLPENLRVQLVSSGITGVKFLQIDFFDLERLEALAPGARQEAEGLPPHAMPTAPSTLKSLEDWVVEMLERAPRVLDTVERVLEDADRALTQLDVAALTSDARATLRSLDGLAGEAREKLAAVDAAALDARATRTLDEAGEALTDVRRVMARLEGPGGLLEHLERLGGRLDAQLGGTDLRRTVADLDATLRALREAADAVEGVAAGGELARALQGIREATVALRRLAEALERDPDMLLKGRSQEGR